MCALILSILLSQEHKSLYNIIQFKVVIVNCSFVTCYKLIGDFFLTLGEGQYLRRWLLMGMLPLVNDWWMTCIE